ncbi:MAG: hypothetical protein M5U34_43985 [Chloroflexi bacterium]|nr:hypothetical protein [Chloroflexota bacterium]
MAEDFDCFWRRRYRSGVVVLANDGRERPFLRAVAAGFSLSQFQKQVGQA